MDFACPDAEGDAAERLLLAKCTSNVDCVDDRRRAWRWLGGPDVRICARVVNGFSRHGLTVAGVCTTGHGPTTSQVAREPRRPGLASGSSDLNASVVSHTSRPTLHTEVMTAPLRKLLARRMRIARSCPHSNVEEWATGRPRLKHLGAHAAIPVVRAILRYSQSRRLRA